LKPHLKVKRHGVDEEEYYNANAAAEVPFCFFMLYRFILLMVRSAANAAIINNNICHLAAVCLPKAADAPPLRLLFRQLSTSANQVWSRRQHPAFKVDLTRKNPTTMHSRCPLNPGRLHSCQHIFLGKMTSAT
jgi:hypothetical protein